VSISPRKPTANAAPTDLFARGSEVIFRSFLVPTLGRYFQGGSTASGLRAKADAAHTD